MHQATSVLPSDPNAAQAQESADLSDEEFEEDEEDEEGQPEDGEINLRGLVAQGGEMSDVSDADEPPRKKKKA